MKKWFEKIRKPLIHFMVLKAELLLLYNYIGHLRTRNMVETNPLRSFAAHVTAAVRTACDGAYACAFMGVAYFQDRVRQRQKGWRCECGVVLHSPYSPSKNNLSDRIIVA